jgi:hypothetical protein
MHIKKVTLAKNALSCYAYSSKCPQISIKRVECSVTLFVPNWSRKLCGYLFQTWVQMWLIDFYYYNTPLLDLIAFIKNDWAIFATILPTPIKKRQFPYGRCIIIDNNANHTKRYGCWNRITRTDSGAKLTQRVSVYIFWPKYVYMCVSRFEEQFISPTVSVWFCYTPAFCMSVRCCSKPA